MDNKKFVIKNKKDFIMKNIKFDTRIKGEIKEKIFMHIQICGYTEKEQIAYIQGYVEGYTKAYLYKNNIV